MEENQTPNNSEPTQNLDGNSRIIQPPSSGEGINAPRPEPPKHQTYQPQPTVPLPPQVLINNAATTPAQAAPAATTPPVTVAPSPQPFGVASRAIPDYADPHELVQPSTSKDYVPGGIYVIAAGMMAPAIYYIYSIALTIIAVGLSHTLSLIQHISLEGFAIILPMIYGMIAGILLFKQKRVGLILVMIGAALLTVWGIISLLPFAALVAGLGGGSLIFSIVTLQLLLPIGVILYLGQKKVRDFVSF